MQTSAYEIYKNQIGVRISFLISDNEKRQPNSLNLLTYNALAQRCKRIRGLRLREGKGSGNESLLSYNNMPHEWQQQCTDYFGNPGKAQAAKFEFTNIFQYDYKANTFYSTYLLEGGNHLSKDLIERFTLNASVLNTVLNIYSIRKAYVKALGGVLSKFWEYVGDEVEAFKAVQSHTLKTAALRKLVAKYKKEGYACLVSGKLGNTNKVKVKTEESKALVEELVAFHNNLDNAAIAKLYNIAAARLTWPTITSGTVAKIRKEADLYTYAGRRGESNFRNTRLMQHKRQGPNCPLVYLTVDGWDAELFYQSTEIDKNGYSRTTYHNRLTVVVVLDPYLKYPLGYAIGTHETTDLIKAALRNAADHTAELFGARYRSHQIQSDHYGKSKLVPAYEGMAKHFTPARVKNAKAKVIEREFKTYNKYCQLHYANWSGFGVTANKENQVNGDMLNKLRHSFPDLAGCAKQIESLIESQRAEKREDYVKRWHEMASEDHLLLTDEDYLFLFGQHSCYTNRLNGNGICPTIQGVERAYDSFDIRLRENRHQDWLIKYDPTNLDKVLAVNATSRNGRLVEEIGTIRIMLEAKYIQPMALYDRKEGDGEALARVDNFNREIEQAVIARRSHNRQLVEEILHKTPAIDQTLAKILITDSRGQHKDNRSAARLAKPQIIEIKEVIKKQPKPVRSNSDREEYISKKINVNEFLSL